MSKGINRVTLIGHLGTSPEMRNTQNGSHVTTLSVATHESWQDRKTNETHSRTEWHRVVLFARLAEIAHQYLAKGSQVYIEGALRTHKWTDQKGQDRFSTEVVANEMQLLGSTRRADSQRSDGSKDSISDEVIPF